MQMEKKMEKRAEIWGSVCFILIIGLSALNRDFQFDKYLKSVCTIVFFVFFYS